MIKWLSKIEVTAEPSNNFYHFRDNRILPPHVTPEIADSEGWWERPRFIFNELNINSAISSPAHGEDVLWCRIVHGKGIRVFRWWSFNYARRVSIDGGYTWSLADHQLPCRPTMYQKQWCWALWSYELMPQSCVVLVRCAVPGMNRTTRSLGITQT